MTNSALMVPGSSVTLNRPTLRTDTGSPLRLGLLIIVLGLGSIGAWAALAPLHSAVMASGSLVPTTGRKTVKTIEGGALAEIKVAEGDRVTAGQVLLRLDSTEAQARHDSLLSHLEADQALLARLDGELFNAPAVTFPPALVTVAATTPEVAKMIDNQQHLFSLRQAEVTKEQSLLGQRLSALETSVSSLSDQRRFLVREIAFCQQELAGVRSLLEHGNATLSRALELEKENTRLQAHDQELASAIAQAHQQISEASAEEVKHMDERREKILNEQHETRTEIGKYEDDLSDATNRLAQRDVVAPDTGTVVGLGTLVKGSVVLPGESIFDVVPDDAGLMVEVHVQPRDIEALRPGLPARLVLTAYDTRSTGTLDGTVEQVSADKITEAATHTSFYLVRIALKDATAHSVHNLRIVPGMPVEARILTAPRTAMAYLLGPLSNSYASAFIQH